MSAALRYAEFDTPVGVLAVATDPGATGDFRCGADGPVVASGFRPLAELLDDLPDSLVGREGHSTDLPEIAAAIGAYFAGDVSALDRVSVVQTGAPFMTEVWQAMRDIPAGQVATYGELAAAAGRPRAARAAGTACATNAVAPFVPCHRVVRGDGAIGEYGYGVDTKAALLRIEGAERGT